MRAVWLPALLDDPIHRVWRAKVMELVEAALAESR